MHFEVLHQQNDRSFALIYRNRDRALASIPSQTTFGYSLTFNEVQLELSDTGLANHVWGYCPRESWKNTDAEPPEATLGELRIVPDSPFVPGVVIAVSKTRLPVFYNEHNHWLCLGNPSETGEFRVKLTPGLIVVGNVSLLFALWLRIDRFDQ